MDIFQALVLGIVQGATEFIPVSSSAHLVLVPALLGWGEPSLAFDTVLHLGTLLAVVLYFLEDWLSLVSAGIGSIYRRSIVTTNEKLFWLVVVGCIPAVIAGVLLKDFFESVFGDPRTVASLLLITAVLLVVAEVAGRRDRDLSRLGWGGAVLVGVLQAFAILPGVSRSGSTIVGGLFSGLKRPEAARYSFLLAAPIIFGAGVVQLPHAIREYASAGAGLVPLIVGFFAAFVVGFGCISFLMKYLRRHALYVFAVYCVLASVTSLVLLANR